MPLTFPRFDDESRQTLIAAAVERQERAVRARRSAAILALALLLAGGAMFHAAAAPPAKPLFTIDDYFRATSLSVQDMTRDGAWLACSISTAADRLPQDNARYGDPAYIGPSQADLVVIETATGRQTRVLPGKAQFRSVAWSEDGRLLAFLLRRGDRFQPVVWDRETGRMTDIALPKNRILDPGSPIAWSPDGRRLFFAMKAPDWAQRCRAMFDRITRGSILVMDTDEPFLEWDALRRLGRLSVPAVLERTTGRWTELLPETMILSQRLTRDGKALVFERDVTEKTDYDVIGGTRNQLEVLSLSDGAPASSGTAAFPATSAAAAPSPAPPQSASEPRILLKPFDRRSFSWSRDGRTFAWADKGDVYIMTVDDAEPRLIVGEKPEPERKEAAAAPADKPAGASDAKPKPKKQSFSVMRLSPDGSQILCSSTRPEPEPETEPDAPGVTPKPKPAPAAAAARRPSPPRQFWLVDAATKERRLVFEFPEDEDKRPELQAVEWSPDGRTVYFSYSATDGYDRGLVKLDLVSKSWTDLRRSDRLASRWRFSEDGSTVVFMESDGDAPDELHAADAGCTAVRTLTDLNPQLRGKALSHTELVSYRDTDGRKLHGVLYYPANYERGKTYPMVTEVYEQYFGNGFNAALNVLTSAGYAVLHPSVNLETGYPGEAWAKGALAAINKVIDMGVADPDRLGIQGTSYGGYATVLLITQTDRFKAAINNSGKVNMVSFYTQSPRLGVRNTHAPEKSQDRIGGTLWEYPERYLAHSAILQADRIKTPLLCITGDLDPNVEALQSQEIYYALRRLGKKCVWLRYTGGAHGGPNSREERADMYKRMIDWYDTYLKADAAKAKAPAAAGSGSW